MDTMKVGASLLALTMAAAFNAGCGSSNNDSNPVNNYTSSTADTTSSEAASNESSMAASSSSAPAETGPDIAAGKTDFEMMCAGCHGADGNGATPIDLSNGLPGGETDLAAFISANMPKAPQDPTSCADDCAENVAAYIESWDDESYTVVAEAGGYTIASISNCGTDIQAATNATVVFNDSTNNIGGWSYVSTNAPYNGLSMNGDSALYDVPGVTASDDSCSGNNTQKVILVKKYADWSQQHANGIEVSIADANKTFADVDHIVFDFKLNSADSVILSKAELMATYGDTITDEQYDHLDQGKAVFAISILDPDGGTKVQSERYIEVDQAAFADQWIRVTIPFDEMELFTGEVWQKNETTIEEQASTVADRIQINPEVLGTLTARTSFGDVIRNLVGGPNDDDWATLNIPETFKELSITIKNVEVHWK